MDLKRGHHLCDVCKKPSPLGWLYACRQDNPGLLRPPKFPSFFSDTIDAELSRSVAMLAELGINDSILESAVQGQYTREQLDIIVDQKIQVLDIIAKKKEKEQENATPPETPNGSSSSDKSRPSLRLSFNSNSLSKYYQRHLRRNRHPRYDCPDVTDTYCEFQCCHRCRPMYRYRVYESLSGIAEGEIEALSVEEAKQLRVSHASVFQNVNGDADQPEAEEPYMLFVGPPKTTTVDMLEEYNTETCVNTERERHWHDELDMNKVVLNHEGASCLSTTSNSPPSLHGSVNSQGFRRSSDLRVLECIPMTPRSSEDSAPTQAEGASDKKSKRKMKIEKAKKRKERESGEGSSRPSPSSSVERISQRTKSVFRRSLKRGFDQIFNGSFTRLATSFSSRKDSKMADDISSVNGENGSVCEQSNDNDADADAESDASIIAIHRGRKRDSKNSTRSSLSLAAASAAAAAVTITSSISTSSFNLSSSSEREKERRKKGREEAEVSKRGEGIEENGDSLRVTQPAKRVKRVSFTEEAVELGCPDIAVQV